jgi:hypothetical protein
MKWIGNMVYIKYAHEKTLNIMLFLEFDKAISWNGYSYNYYIFYVFKYFIGISHPLPLHWYHTEEFF